MGRHYYALFMFLSLAVFLAVRHLVPRPPALAAQPLWKRVALGLAAFIGGVLGAKLPFALGAPQGIYTPEAWLTDGKTVVAGLIGGYLAVEYAKWTLGIHVKTGDTWALPLACAMAVGRWGCFLNGCCHGTPTELPWGVTFDLNGAPTVCHPTQIYESLFHLWMAGILLLMLRARVWTGHHLQFYLIAYGLFRFATEFIRPEPIWALGLTFYQWASLVLVLGLAAQWRIETRSRPL
jgi:phosphatidylglycerol:prolipoprotein diacylglycerol transferase